MSRTKTFLLFALFGLAPLWVTTTLVILGSRGANSEYWNAAPWLMVFSIPVCGVTLVIALVTRLIAGRNPNSMLPGIVLGSGIVVSVALVWAYAPREKAPKMSSMEEQRLAERFVENHPDVVEALHGASKAQVTRTTLRGGEPAQYYLDVTRPPKLVMARVAVSRSGGRPRFTLECMMTGAEFDEIRRNRCVTAD